MPVALFFDREKLVRADLLASAFAV